MKICARVRLLKLREVVISSIYVGMYVRTNMYIIIHLVCRHRAGLIATTFYPYVHLPTYAHTLYSLEKKKEEPDIADTNL